MAKKCRATVASWLWTDVSSRYLAIMAILVMQIGQCNLPYSLFTEKQLCFSSFYYNTSKTAIKKLYDVSCN